jgi:hypothetical protein
MVMVPVCLGFSLCDGPDGAVQCAGRNRIFFLIYFPDAVLLVKKITNQVKGIVGAGEGTAL